MLLHNMQFNFIKLISDSLCSKMKILEIRMAENEVLGEEIHDPFKNMYCLKRDLEKRLFWDMISTEVINEI